MCYYISKVRGYEVLMMQAEFFKDENGFIWFYYSHNITVRKNLYKVTVNGEEAKKEAKKMANNKDRMRK